METLSVVQNRPLPSSWNKWALVTNRDFFHAPSDHALPSKYYPSNKFVFTYEIFDNNMYIPCGPNVTAFTALQGLAGLGGGGSAIGMLTGVRSAQTFSLTRRYSYGGGDGGAWYFPSDYSPRVGFSIGDYFKYQGYASLKGMVTGVTEDASCVIAWTGADYTSFAMEYDLNCRLRQLYLKHGRIISMRNADESSAQQEASDSRDIWIKVLEDNSAFNSTNGASGEIKIYSKSDGKWVVKDYEIIEASSDGEVKVTIGGDKVKIGEVGGEKDTIQSSKIKVGDFFEIDSTWLVNDPALIHEYGLGIRNGMYGADAQIWNVPGTDYSDLGVIGVWVGGTEKKYSYIDEDGVKQDKTFIVYTPFLDKEYRNVIYLPETENEQFKRKEDMVYGGSFSEGVKKLQETNADVVRLQLNFSGSNGAQNFCANNLAGQFVDIEGSFFEIVDNPRGDVIEVNNISLTDDRTLISLTKKGMRIQVYQQKFWLFNEIFIPEGINFSKGIYGGIVKTSTVSKKTVNDQKVSVIELTWTSKDDGRTEVPQRESQLTNCKTLLQRIKSKISISGDSSVPMYKKYGGWKVYNADTRLEAEIIDFNIIESADEKDGEITNYEITASIMGSSADDFKGSEVRIVFGDTFKRIGYPTTSGVTFSAYPERVQSGVYNLLINGIWDIGAYDFPAILQDNKRFSIVQTRFGIKVGEKSAPGLYASTKTQLLYFTACCENIIDNKKHVVFQHPYYNNLMHVSYRDQMKDQKAARIGPAKKASDITGSDINSAALLTVTGSHASIGTLQLIKKGEDDVDYYSSYWIKMPKKQNGVENTYYYSMKINGRSGVETMLTRRYNLRLYEETYETTNVVSAGTLPLEIASPTPISGSSAGHPPTIYTPFFYVPSSNDDVIDESSQIKLVSTEGRESELVSLLSNGVVLGGEGADDIKYEYEYTPANRLVISAINCRIHYLKNGKMVLIVGTIWPEGTTVSSQSEADSSKSGYEKYITNILVSTNNGLFWVSPRQTLRENEMEKAAEIYPLTIAKDFLMIDTVFDEENSVLYVFGYLGDVKDPTKVGTAGIDELNSKEVCLTMYKFPMSYCLEGDYSELKKVSYGEEQLILSYYKQPDAKQFKFEDDVKFNTLDNFAQILSRGGSKNAFSPQLTSEKISSEDTFCVSRNSGGYLRIYYSDPVSGGIICMFSDNSGHTWDFVSNNSFVAQGDIPSSIEEARPIIYARSAESPSIIGSFLFYFRGTKLYMNEGLKSSNQETLDSLAESLIADNIPPQRISGLTSSDGGITIFYIDSAGTLKALETKNKGAQWKTPVNW